MINILILTNELNYTDGITSHLFYLLGELKKKNDLNIFLGCSGGDSVKRFKDIGIKILEDKNLNHKNRNIKNFSKIMLSLLKFSKQNKINIIHSHNHYAANVASYISKFINIKTIQTIHGLIPQKGRLNHFKAHKFISLNETITEYLLKNKIATKENINLIRHGFPVILNLNKKPKSEVKIICAARLVYEKGIDNFINASKLVLEKYDGKVKFLIAGEGEYENELKLLCKDLNVEITFLGNVKNLIEIFIGTCIFVMPSRIRSEGFPISIVEAAFTKNLIISSRFDSLDSILKDETDGLTFEIDNHKELANKIIFALENPEIVSQMEKNFYNKAVKLFNLEAMANKHFEFYCECCVQ